MRMSSFLFFSIAHAVFSRRSRFSIHVASISFLFLYVRVLMDQEAKPRVGEEATLSCASHFFIAPRARSLPRCSNPSCMPRWSISSRVLTISRVFGYRHADVLAWSCICLHTHQQSCKIMHWLHAVWTILQDVHWLDAVRTILQDCALVGCSVEYPARLCIGWMQRGLSCMILHWLDAVWTIFTRLCTGWIDCGLPLLSYLLLLWMKYANTML